MNTNGVRSTKMDGNIDASFLDHENKIGLEICIRDDDGTFALAKTGWHTDVHVGAVLGLLLGLQWFIFRIGFLY